MEPCQHQGDEETRRYQDEAGFQHELRPVEPAPDDVQDFHQKEAHGGVCGGPLNDLPLHEVGEGIPFFLLA